MENEVAVCILPLQSGLLLSRDLYGLYFHYTQKKPSRGPRGIDLRHLLDLFLGIGLSYYVTINPQCSHQLILILIPALNIRT
jgi:hypothetical protein